MKKEYESPKAEKMVFNYSETIVASGCKEVTPMGDDASVEGCKTTPQGPTQYNEGY